MEERKEEKALIWLGREATQSNFEHGHSANLEEIQIARAIVKGNLQIISHFIENGSLTKKRQAEIWMDHDLQEVYAMMADAEMTGDKKTYDRGFKDIGKKPDTLCGWLDFYNQYLEATLNMPLVEKSRLDSLVERYFEEE